MSYQTPIEDRSCCPFVSAPQSLFVPTTSKSALGAVPDALSGEVTSDIFEDVLAHCWGIETRETGATAITI